MMAGYLNTLHFKIAVGVVVTILLLTAALTFLNYRIHQAETLRKIELSASELTDVTLQALLELAMLGRHPELLQPAIEKLGARSSVRGIELLGTDGGIRFSSDPTRSGLFLTTQDEGCHVCHDRADKPPLRSSFWVKGDEEVLRHAAPVANRPECHSCHDPLTPTLGLLLVDYTTAGAYSELRASTLEMAVYGAAIGLVILLVLGFLLRRLVISRIESLVRATERIREGDFKILVPIGSKDEIGTLAQTVNEMTASLTRYQQEVEEKEQVRVSLLRRLVDAHEEERASIARELHDQLGQSLSAILLGVQRSSRFGDSSSTEYRQIESKIRKTIDDVHNLAQGMRPPVLDEYGLDSALGQHIRMTAREFGIHFDYEYRSPKGSKRLPKEVELTLYRIAQEAITNIVRHARTDRASVVILRRRQEVTLLVEDNGRGFDPQIVFNGNNRRLGLVGIQERVGLFGGTCAIESVPSEGTTVRVRIPLPME